MIFLLSVVAIAFCLYRYVIGHTRTHTTYIYTDTLSVTHCHMPSGSILLDTVWSVCVLVAVPLVVVPVAAVVLAVVAVLVVAVLVVVGSCVCVCVYV